MMANDEHYFISVCGYLLANNDISMSFSELRKTMQKFGLKPSVTNRGLANQDKATYYEAVNEKNQDIADCIANAFTKDNGRYAWE